jgi:hypothetical protein
MKLHPSILLPSLLCILPCGALASESETRTTYINAEAGGIIDAPEMDILASRTGATGVGVYAESGPVFSVYGSYSYRSYVATSSLFPDSLIFGLDVYDFQKGYQDTSVDDSIFTSFGGRWAPGGYTMVDGELKRVITQPYLLGDKSKGVTNARIVSRYSNIGSTDPDRLPFGGLSARINFDPVAEPFYAGLDRGNSLSMIFVTSNVSQFTEQPFTAGTSDGEGDIYFYRPVFDPVVYNTDTPPPVPEPGLLVAAGAGLAALVRKRKPASKS